MSAEVRVVSLYLTYRGFVFRTTKAISWLVNMYLPNQTHKLTHKYTRVVVSNAMSFKETD